MTKQYATQPKIKYNPAKGVLNARLFLSTPELETELENIIDSIFKQIGTSDKTGTLTHTTTKYFLKEDHNPRKSILEQLGCGLEKLFGKEPEPICTVSYIHDSSQNLPRMNITVILPVKGSNAEQNQELIQNLGRKLDGIYEKTQTQCYSGSGSQS